MDLMSVGAGFVQNSGKKLLPKVSSAASQVFKGSSDVIDSGSKAISNYAIGQINSVQIKPCGTVEEMCAQLVNTYAKNIGDVKNQYSDMFSHLGTISTRSKGYDSTLSKLKSKLSPKCGEIVSYKKAAECIGDGYGVRLTLGQLNPQQADDIISKSRFTPQEFHEIIKGDLSKLDDKTKIDVLRTLEQLKEAQTQPMVNSLIEMIDSGKVNLADDVFNNYGTEITSYFSQKQLADIATVYKNKTGKPLAFVNKIQLSEADFSGYRIDGAKYKPSEYLPDADDSTVQKWINKSDKDSGYVSTQMNIVTDTTNGTPLADLEMQIRGPLVHDFAEVEHVPYDIRTGKIDKNHKDYKKYESIYSTIKCLDADSYDKYNTYLKAMYKHLRLQELGIPSAPPKLEGTLKFVDEAKLPEEFIGKVTPGAILSDNQILSYEGLKALKSKS